MGAGRGSRMMVVTSGEMVKMFGVGGVPPPDSAATYLCDWLLTEEGQGMPCLNHIPQS